MPFLIASIDRAIVMTQYDLRGFGHPLGFRIPAMNPKSLYILTGNFIGFAAMVSNDQTGPADESYVKFSSDASFEERLAMCHKLAASCDKSQKEAIQLIVKEIVVQSEQMKAKVAAGTRESSNYLMPLDKTNCWGMTVLALAEAFEVVIEPVATPAPVA